MKANGIRQTANMAMALLGAALHNTIGRQVEQDKIPQLVEGPRRDHYTRKSKRTYAHAVNPAGTKIARKIKHGTCTIHHANAADDWHLQSNPSRVGRRLGV